MASVGKETMLDDFEETIFRGIVKHGAEWCLVKLVEDSCSNRVLIKFPGKPYAVAYNDVTDFIVNMDTKTLKFFARMDIKTMSFWALAGIDVDPIDGSREIYFHDAWIDPTGCDIIENGERVFRRH